MSNIHGLHSSGSASKKPFKLNEASDDSDEETQFAGGLDQRGGGSGMAVLPNPGDKPVSPLEALVNSAKSDSEGGNHTPAAISHTITMWSDGFTVNEGVYRRLDDENNKIFLADLAKGVVPRELQTGATPGNVDVKLVDKRRETYVPPDYIAFSGGGNSMVSDAPVAEGLLTSESVTEAPIIVDDGLPNRQEKVAKVQKGTTVRHLVGVIKFTMDQAQEVS